jgi:hypothetical protein
MRVTVNSVHSVGTGRDDEMFKFIKIRSYKDYKYVCLVEAIVAYTVFTLNKN